MPVTRIADIIQPELFARYVIDRTAELSRLVESGIITRNTILDDLITGGGVSLTMPSWNDLSGSSQVLNDVDPIEVDRITAKAEIATLLIRANAWGTHELAGALAGDDPMQALVQLVSRWWVRDEQKTLFAMLKGVFESPSMEDLKHDASALPISPAVVFDAKQRLGDAADQLTAIGMHSATYTELQKQGAIVLVPNLSVSIGPRLPIEFPTYLGYRVIVDDGMPYDPATGVYTSYLFANGVIARGEGTPVSLTSVETDRDSLGSTDYLINRRAMVLHPMGISWLGVGKTQDPTPSNAELADGENWNRVKDVKKIGIVKVMHKLTA